MQWVKRVVSSSWHNDNFIWKNLTKETNFIAEADFAEPNSKFNAAFKLTPGLILISSMPSKNLLNL